MESDDASAGIVLECSLMQLAWLRCAVGCQKVPNVNQKKTKTTKKKRRKTEELENLKGCRYRKHAWSRKPEHTGTSSYPLAYWEGENSNYSSSHSRIYLRQNVSHTAGRVPTDPTTFSCSWDNRSGRGETECARMTRTCAWCWAHRCGSKAGGNLVMEKTTSAWPCESGMAT